MKKWTLLKKKKTTDTVLHVHCLFHINHLNQLYSEILLVTTFRI